MVMGSRSLVSICYNGSLFVVWMSVNWRHSLLQFYCRSECWTSKIRILFYSLKSSWTETFPPTKRIKPFKMKDLEMPLEMFTSSSFYIYLVRHERGEGASNLMIVQVGLTWTKQDENKANRDGDLQHRLQKDRLVQPDKGHGGLLQEVHRAWQATTTHH